MEAAYKLIRQIQQGMISFGPSCQKAPSPTLLVYPRQAENEISNVSIAMTEPKLSQVQASSQDLLSSNLIKEITYYNTRLQEAPFRVTDSAQSIR